MSVVYATQRPSYYDRSKRGWVNKFDLSPALEFGELLFLLPPGNIWPHKLEEAVRKIETKLADFTPKDYILAVGDPVAISAAVMAASEVTAGDVSVLKFNRQENSYTPYRIQVLTGGVLQGGQGLPFQPVD